MLNKLILFYKILQIYKKYFNLYLIELYIYFASPWPIYSFLKKLALANRNIKVTLFPKTTGRPSLDEETINLILKLKQLNPTWGAQRISDELKKVGYKASKQTVLKYLEIYGLLPTPPHQGMTWKEFLKSHNFLIGIDFTSKISLWGDQLFFFSILDLKSRELIYIGVTLSPNFCRIKQQFKNAFLDIDIFPSHCICDRDRVFSFVFKSMMLDFFGIKVIQTPIKTPQMNGKVERFNRSLKEESLGNVIPISFGQTVSVCRDYQNYYNNHRPHQGIDGKIPAKDNLKTKERLEFKTQKHFSTKFTTLEKIVA